ncbi:MAG: UvrD-helicase domain-containing protein [Firmicutes bacterium]|nr:UvrD-helicase domain-containing protein [Bacillota bacterium]
MDLDRFTPAQRAAILSDCDEILVSASAGSGKTTVMIQRILRLLTAGEELSSMVVCTFTKAAAADMRTKLLQQLSGQWTVGGGQLKEDGFMSRIPTSEKGIGIKAQGTGIGDMQNQLPVPCALCPDTLYPTTEPRSPIPNPRPPTWASRAIGQLPTAQISTIDAFCASIAREYFYYADDIDPAFEVLDEAESDALLNLSVDEAIAEAAQDSGQWTVDSGQLKEDELISRTPNPEPRAPSSEPRTQGDFLELFEILSPRRNDKRMAAIVKRIYEFSAIHPDPDAWFEKSAAATQGHAGHIAALSENYKSLLGGFLRRAAELKTTCEHAGFVSCAASVAVFYDEVAADAGELKRLPVIKPASDAQAALYERYKKLRGAYKDFCAERDEALSYADPALAAGHTALLVELAKSAAKIFAAKKRRKSRCDFNDIERAAYRILCNPDAAAEIGARFRWLMVDEFQDVNPLQDAIFSRIAAKRFYVGDVKQSIYGFRLSDPGIFAGYEDEKFVIRLNANFRSDSGILRFCDRVFSDAMTREFGGVDYAGTACFNETGLGALGVEPVVCRLVGNEELGVRSEECRKNEELGVRSEECRKNEELGVRSEECRRDSVAAALPGDGGSSNGDPRRGDTSAQREVPRRGGESLPFGINTPVPLTPPPGTAMSARTTVGGEQRGLAALAGDLATGGPARTSPPTGMNTPNPSTVPHSSFLIPNFPRPEPRTPTPDPRAPYSVKNHVFPDADADTSAEAAEADAVTAHILSLKKRFIAEDGAERAAEFGDIAVLLRSMGKFAGVLSEKLRRAGVPVTMQKSADGAENPAIRGLINYLRLIDNRRDDIALVSVLKSPLGGYFSDGELAQIRLWADAQPDGGDWPFFEACEKYCTVTAQQGDGGSPSGDPTSTGDWESLITALPGDGGSICKSTPTGVSGQWEVFSGQESEELEIRNEECRREFLVRSQGVGADGEVTALPGDVACFTAGASPRPTGNRECSGTALPGDGGPPHGDARRGGYGSARGRVYGDTSAQREVPRRGFGNLLSEIDVPVPPTPPPGKVRVVKYYVPVTTPPPGTALSSYNGSGSQDGLSTPTGMCATVPNPGDSCQFSVVSCQLKEDGKNGSEGIGIRAQVTGIGDMRYPLPVPCALCPDTLPPSSDPRAPTPDPRPPNPELSQKLQALFANLARYENLSRVLSFADLAGKVCAEHDYFKYAFSLPDAHNAADGLSKFLDRLSALSAGRDFAAALLAAEAGAVKLSGGGEADAVRIMTVHAAKGLEFPFVILPNLSKNFNLDDVKRDCILDVKFGAVLKWFDLFGGQTVKTSLYRRAVLEVRKKLCEEEMRILYVACTRAKFHLALFSRIKKDYEPKEGIDARCWLDWLYPAMVNITKNEKRKTKNDGGDASRQSVGAGASPTAGASPRPTGNQESLVAALPGDGGSPSGDPRRGDTSVAKCPAGVQKSCIFESTPPSPRHLPPEKQGSENFVACVRKFTDFVYPHPQLPVKTTVTQLAREGGFSVGNDPSGVPEQITNETKNEKRKMRWRSAAKPQKYAGGMFFTGAGSEATRENDGGDASRQAVGVARCAARGSICKSTPTGMNVTIPTPEPLDSGQWEVFSGQLKEDELISRTPNPDPRIPNPEPRVPSPDPRIPNPEPRVPPPEPAYGTDVGDAYHKFLETADFSKPFPENFDGFSKNYPDFARLLQKNTANTALEKIAERVSRRKFYRELPFIYCMENGVLLQGVIDLLIEDADGMVEIVDYKTGKLAEEFMASYRRQIGLYALAAGRILKKRVARKSVFAVSGGEFIEM